MSRKQTIIRGTFILTATGFLCRFMGFFYRIFLSHTFGEEGVGLYQLIFPVYSLCFALTAAGLETAISRTVAQKVSLGRKKEARQILMIGLVLSVLLSCACVLILQGNAAYIAEKLLGDARCEPLLIPLSYALPFAAIHSCICGYCYGMKETKIPALSQVVEQVTRIISVYVFYLILMKKGDDVTITIAVLGLVIGEMLSALYAAKSLTRSSHVLSHLNITYTDFVHRFRELMPLSLPLTANRVLINLLQSIEAISIPARLQLYNHSTSEALSIYGVLTGMALPCILFPSAITSSISIMLMPTVAEIQTTDNRDDMVNIIKKVAGSCFILGLSCCFIFLVLGNWMGTVLFGSSTAGKFIITLAWMCPFLYTNSALLSVINGLGKTAYTFLINSLGLIIRIGSVFAAIPLFGIQGYLWGMLASQLIVSICAGIVLKKEI
ncbi:polysaccharide biosynthesis protein [Eubacterium sp. am_0171]|uniref:Probable cell division protein ytgP n=1 Tax=Faecalicatena contorta TaxID=39482 RepID=A0A174KFH7_9FIRM|nr:MULTISPECIES: polysaccharide biosynthesis protein [Clostridia]MSC85831.1 oligosaccharide flippase family protein [Eubacterium sp. BIOML-A1]MSD08170.1 oligosaccharide flippase family protein [Eubacterium sp. BIOML-A2]RYT12914.1 polysaccharide biosynthesis protein [Eubacterium sp. am_0171]CUP10672.1 Probable cell division protein ytgP [[Eubacterium] contortum] [Faecalicatena contorta]